MVNILKKFKHSLYYFCLKISIFVKSRRKNVVYLLGTPKHGNLGDQAILYSELKLFSDLGKKNVIYVESSFVKNNISFLKKIIGDKRVYIHGGGFMGTIWPTEEMMLRNILENFKDNEIIVFPQTVYFDKNESFFEESKKIYSLNKRVVFMMREEFSYEFMKKNMSKCNSILVPDIVLYNKCIEYKSDRKNCLLCIRNDKEKVQYDFEKIKKILDDKKLDFNYTDTVIKKGIYKFNRKKELYKKFKQFSCAKLIITDRLHGMVFAYITETPCLVLENSSYKVKGLYKWLEKCNYIKLYNSNTVKQDINNLLELKKINRVDLNQEFDKIKSIIK